MAMLMNGFISGKVMKRNWSTGLAPSIAAAS
jgi:hypothetical protein